MPEGIHDYMFEHVVTDKEIEEWLKEQRFGTLKYQGVKKLLADLRARAVGHASMPADVMRVVSKPSPLRNAEALQGQALHNELARRLHPHQPRAQVPKMLEEAYINWLNHRPPESRVWGCDAENTQQAVWQKIGAGGDVWYNDMTGETVTAEELITRHAKFYPYETFATPEAAEEDGMAG